MKALYPGTISGKEIIIKIGPLDHLQQNDEVMADMGFLIHDEPVASVGATLTVPAFLSGRKHFSKEDTATNKKVACLRVHVERCVERIKKLAHFGLQNSSLTGSFCFRYIYCHSSFNKFSATLSFIVF